VRRRILNGGRRPTRERPEGRGGSILAQEGNREQQQRMDEEEGATLALTLNESFEVSRSAKDPQKGERKSTRTLSFLPEKVFVTPG